MRTKPTLALASLLAAAVAVPAAHGQAGAPAVKPSADFFVAKTKPRRNYGAVKELVGGRGRSYAAFMRFRLATPGSRAVLRLFPMANSSTGLVVRRATGGVWAERKVTFARAPRLGAGGVASGPLTKGQPVDLDVTRLVGSGTTVSLGFVTTSQSPVVVGSRENAALAPQLFVG